jgi:class 3 adenylate cyclase/KaiC/GvpD/RAD55 family RecA-like ATPase
MFTDMVGYTSMAQKNETQAVELLEEHRVLLKPLFQKHNGRVIDAVGDGFLVEFASAIDSVNCAVEIQSSLDELNKDRVEDKKILLRIGIHLGDVIHKGEYVMGDAVNVASRIEPLALPGGICVTQQVFDNVRNKVEYSIVPFGAHDLNHVELPVNIYRVTLPWESTRDEASHDSYLLETPASDKETKTLETEFRSGIESLDQIIGGGYPSRSTVLVIGPPGIGKEAIGYWFTHLGLTDNEFCIYATRLSTRAVLHDVKAYAVDFAQRVPFWFSGDGGEVKLNLNDLASLFTNFEEIVRKNGARRIRIAMDITSSLLMLNSPEVIYKFLSQLFDQLKHYDSVLVATLEEGMHSPNVMAAMQQLFDGVIELKFYEKGLSVIPLLRIKKMRGVPPLPGYFNFFFSKTGMEVRAFDQQY